MRKFDLVEDPAYLPTRIWALPELLTPPQTNATRTLLTEAKENGWSDRVAYYCEDQTWTYQDLADAALRYASALQALGIGPEDRVMMRMMDTPDLAAALLAVTGLGAIAVPTFTQLRADDIAYRVQDCQAKVLLVEEALLEEVTKAINGGCSIEHVVVTDGQSGGAYKALSDLADDIDTDDPWADTHGDDVCLILYTSGTTGRPKAAVHCHRDLLATGDTFSRYILCTQPDDIFIGPPPLPFAMGLAFFMYYPLRFGAAAVLVPSKTPEAFIKAFADHKPTLMASVPTFYQRLLGYQREHGDLQLASFRKLLCAGEPLYQEVETAWNEETGVPLEQTIGTTEMLHALIGFRAGQDDNRFATLGRASPGYEVSVRDPDTFEVMAPGEPGLFCIWGPTATVYWSPEGAQEAAVRDGWNVIQDMIAMDGEGYLTFVARADEMILSGGMNISPVDVERALLKHPAVVECACVPSPDDKGERAMVPKAFVVLSDGEDSGDAMIDTLQTFVKETAPPYMYPRKIEFIDAIPKSLTGKIQRSVLKKREFPA